ncbi:uncharacterized protein LOC124279666 isoform X2 [Haliotis rubra]|uniref:uncharacterized protein LOC124279666 isoform X2 n=1 Tax=Haliotis rubra TaxID=36100 RepID=UPI001EE5B5BA|nr:uncharacterized protein LOC124279666 isoform X2 [Haliotis rubra]
MKVFGWIGSLFLVIQQSILAPVLSVCTFLAGLVKIFSSLGAVFNFIAGRKRPSQPTTHHDPAPKRPRTDIDVVGKDSSGYSPYVQTTGVEAENASDVKEVLHGVRRLNTTGIKNGSAGTVITTGICLGSLRSRARD